LARISTELIPIEETTDYDYVAEFYEEELDYFGSIGFHRKRKVVNSADKYASGDTVVVLYKNVPGKPEVQLILKKDVWKYLRIQESITPQFYKDHLWKKYTPVEKIGQLLNILYDNYKDKIT